MTGLKFCGVIVGIIGLTMVIHVHGNDIEDSVKLNRTKRAPGDATVEYFISSNALNWKDSKDHCSSNRYRLAHLSLSKKEALVNALDHQNFRDRTKFWIYSCTGERSSYSYGQCAELLYIKPNEVRCTVLSGADCVTKHRYICEKVN